MENGKTVRVWFDPEGDYLEVSFSNAPGTFEETENDQVMVKVNDEGDVLGFSILSVSRIGQKPVDVSLQVSA